MKHLRILILLLFAYGLGVGVAYVAIPSQVITLPAQVITLPAPPPEIIEVVKEVETRVYVDRPIERIKEVPQNLKDFQSPEELIGWLADDTTNEIPAKLDFGGVLLELWCMDYAEMLRQSAQEGGYRLNVQVFSAGTQLPMSDRVVDTAHAMNTARIGDGLWLIEPQTDKAWRAYHIR